MVSDAFAKRRNQVRSEKSKSLGFARLFVPRTLWRTRISCYAAPGQNRVCGFLRKPHAARQRHQPRQEIRGMWGTRRYNLTRR